MKKLFIIIFIATFSILISILIVLSTIGFETNKFNKIISEKATENNKNVSLNLQKVKFKFDIKEFDLFIETKNPELTYKSLLIPISKVRAYLNFSSLIRSNTKIEKVSISSEEVNIDQLKRIIIKTKPSNLNSLIINKIKNGKLIINLELYLNDNLEIDNFIAKGKVEDMNASISNDFTLTSTSFNFFGDTSDILIKNVKSKIEGLIIKDGNFHIKNDKEINIKSDFTTLIDINEKNITKYLPILEKIRLINIETNFSGEVNNFLNLTFDKTFKITNYIYSNKGRINKSYFKLNKALKNPFLEQDIEKLHFKNTIFDTRYSLDKKNYINFKGQYSFDEKNYQNFNFKNNFFKDVSKTILNTEVYQKINIDFINYKKDVDKKAKIFLDFSRKKDLIDLNEFKYFENKNLISVENLRLDKKGLVSLKNIKVKTFNKDNLKNDFTLDFGKKIKISGTRYDAKNLNKFFNKKSKSNLLNKINKEIYIDIKNIDTPLSKKLKNFRLIGAIEKGKFTKISSKGDFGDNKFLDISMKSDKKNGRKFLEVYSDLPQPLLSEYSFFNGLTEGVLNFSSIIENDTSSSILVIDDFKVVNAPGVVKLLSLADFGGLADLAEGEGLSFEKLEIKMDTNKGFLKLNELYAVGPSISVLMEGYKEESGLTSLRGTLVPAKNLNKFLSKIPVIGKIIIPKDIGEGLFGVSFKIKGMPEKMKTTINPIKTLTPRFITKALEKQKKAK
ncbi:MAG: hypothetical protein CBD26_04195 [Candidatus Pelagibacter sp. TMED166]|nr:MAG: hypothetical protein CBD26_04195 [Candidatus Pelagibacter sp. TMED166]